LEHQPVSLVLTLCEDRFRKQLPALAAEVDCTVPTPTKMGSNPPSMVAPG
jgi:hypothetical protein